MLFSQFFFKSESNTKFSYFKTLPQNVKCSSVSFYFKLIRATQNMCLTPKLSHMRKIYSLRVLVDLTYVQK